MSTKTIEVKDAAGNDAFTLVEVDGITFPKYFCEEPLQRLKDVREMAGRDDDVIIAAYPKAGTHWVWEITNMLLRDSADYHPDAKEEQMLELNGPAGWETKTSPRVLNSHLRFRQLPADMISRNCKIIYVTRNPKDMAVSRHHHMTKTGAVKYRGSFADYLPVYLDGLVAFGSWFDYTLEWQSAIEDNKGYHIHNVVYEEMKKDPIGATTRLSEFLGVNADQALVKAISEQCSFANLKSSYQKKSFKGELNPTEYSFRTGTIGDWKNTFTVAQNEKFDNKITDKMTDYKGTFIYE